jgi:UDP-N-acetylglucosamine transferase subunit ALG13
VGTIVGNLPQSSLWGKNYMIFITVGSQKFPFDRLIKKMDEICADHKNELGTVFAQIGSSNYIPKYMEYVAYLNKKEFEQKIQTCSLLITHAAVGAMISGLHNQKKIIAVPRLSSYGEHIDDHQLELGKELDRLNYLCFVSNIDDIYNVIQKIQRTNLKRYNNSPERIVNYIEQLMIEN